MARKFPVTTPFVEKSPLNAFGYNVKESFLDDDMRLKIILRYWMVGPGQEQAWGEPESFARAQKIIHHLESCINVRISNPRYAVALIRWYRDLLNFQSAIEGEVGYIPISLTERVVHLIQQKRAIK